MIEEKYTYDRVKMNENDEQYQNKIHTPFCESHGLWELTES